MQSNKVSLFSLILACCAFVICILFCLNITKENAQDILSNVRANSGDIALVGDNLAPLNLYLKNLAGLSNEQSLNEDIFINATEIIFDGNTQLGENLIAISSLELFKWDNLTKIEIKNTNKLVEIELCDENGIAFFPVLTEIIINNCSVVTDLDLRGNNQIEKLSVTDCNALENLNLPVLNGVREITLTNLPKLVGEYYFKDSNTVHYSNLEKLNISNVINLKELIFTGVSLKELILKNNEALTVINITNVKNLATCHVQNLINLKLFLLSDAQLLGNPDANGSIKFDENDDEKMMLKSEKLETFLLTNNAFLSNLSLPNASKLQTLKLNGCEGILSLELNENLNELINLDLQNLKILTKLDIVTASKLQEINLYNCRGLNPFNYPDFNDFTNLEYLNLSYSSIDQINLNNSNNLTYLLLQNCEALKNISLTNLTKLGSLTIKDSGSLQDLNIENCEKINSIAFEGLNALKNLTMKNIGLTDIKLYGLTNLLFCEIASLNLLSLDVKNCLSLQLLKFSECNKLNQVILYNNPLLANIISEEIKALKLLEFITIGNCENITQIVIEDTKNLKQLDISSQINLFTLSLKKIGDDDNADKTTIKLPNEFNKMKSIILAELSNCNFVDALNRSITSLKISNGILNKVEMSDVPFRSLNFSNNMLIVVDFINLNQLRNLSLQNNKITNFIKLDNQLSSCEYISSINLHNNRFDFADKEVYKQYNKSSKKQYYTMGLQNVISNLTYNYEPTIYYGEFDSFFTDGVKMEILKSSKNYDKIDFQNLSSSFKVIKINENTLKTLSSGTYVILFYRLNNNNEKEIIMFGDDYYDSYKQLTFQVALSIDYIKYIWLIFVALAAALYAYIIIMFLLDKAKLRRLRIDEDGLSEYELDFSKRDLKEMQREKRRRIKENIKNSVDSENDEYLQALEEKIKKAKANSRVNLLSKKMHNKTMHPNEENNENTQTSANEVKEMGKINNYTKETVNIKKEKDLRKVQPKNSIANEKRPVLPNTQKSKNLDVKPTGNVEVKQTSVVRPPVLPKMGAKPMPSRTPTSQNATQSVQSPKPTMPKLPKINKN